MPNAPQPHLDHFLANLGNERLWGQLVVRRDLGTAHAFELRHAIDRTTPASQLREVSVEHLRTLAQSGADGRFRPLKGAPNLPAGWRCHPRSHSELAEALHHVYPGSLADAWALATRRAAPADFADVAARQLGRAQALTRLSGEALKAVVSAGCGPASCVKHRLWTAEGLATDPLDANTAIPCLEPCPFFLGFARTCAGIEQAATVSVEFAPDDLATLAAALRHALDHPPRDLREGDVAAPLHSWRVARVLARYSDLGTQDVSHPTTPDE